MINLNDSSTIYHAANLINNNSKVSKSHFNQNAQNENILNQKNQNFLNILDVYFNQNATKINDLYKKVNDLQNQIDKMQGR